MNSVLILFETSGNIKNAFLKKGYDAWSFDMLPSTNPYHHICGFWNPEQYGLLFDRKWKMIISHPDCTNLAVCGARHFKNKKQKQFDSIKMFMEVTELSCQYLAIENPVGIMSTLYRSPDQYIHPYQFGHMEQKKTCLWLKNLPLLTETKNVYAKMMKLPKNMRERIHYMPPSIDRGQLRSITYPGIARAMVDQWGKYLL